MNIYERDTYRRNLSALNQDKSSDCITQHRVVNIRSVDIEKKDARREEALFKVLAHAKKLGW